MAKRRRTRVVVFSGVLLLGCSGAGDLADSGVPSEESGQELSVDSIVNYINKAFSYYNSGVKILSKLGIISDPDAKGPDLSQQLSQVQSSILQELQKQRVGDLEDDIKNALLGFVDVSLLRPDDPTLPSNRDYYQRLTGDLMINFANRVARDEPIDGTYALAPAFNTLVTNYVALLKMKGEQDPQHPIAWGTYNARLKEAFNADYALAGAQLEACSAADSNPGRPLYCLRSWACSLKEPSVKNTYRGSKLYTQKFGNFTHRITGCKDSRLRNCGSVSCNVGQYKCWDGGAEHVCSAPGTPAMRETFSACLAQAGEIADRAFNADSTVKVVRAGIAGIMQVGGGQSPRDDTNTTLPTRKPQYMGFDPPWMVDPVSPRWINCGTMASPYARLYVVTP